MSKAENATTKTETLSHTSTDDLDEPSKLELEIAEKQSKLADLQGRSKNLLTILIVGGFLGLGYALFGRSLLQQYQTNTIVENAPIVGLGLIGSVLYACGFASLLLRNRISTLKQELDVLAAKKRILNRSSGRTETTSEQSVSYFDRLVDINVTNLGAYYSLVKIHTNNSFLVSIAAGSIGFVLIVVGLVVGFTNSANAQTITYVASGSGVITEFIAGVFFYIYNRTIRQMKEYHDSLLAVQNILLSFKIVGDTKDENEKAKMVSSMLAYLVNRQVGVVVGNNVRQDREVKKE